MKNPRNTVQIGAEIRPYVRLVRHLPSGIAAVLDGHGGGMHTCHPNIDASGSVTGMKNRGYWRRGDRTVRAMGYIYNTSELVISSTEDRIAALACRCGGEGCARYQANVGFGPGVHSYQNADPERDEAVFEKVAAIERAAEEKARQALIPDEDAELVIDAKIGIICYLDAEGLPPEGSRERKMILAEHVIDWFQTVGNDPDLVADFIDGEQLIEKRNIGLSRPLAAPVAVE